MTRTVIKLVVFFTVCLVFTAYLAFTIGNIHLFRATYTLHATFDDVTGLLRDDNVKVAGVVVGKVTGVKLEQGKASVSFSVRKSMKVPSDSSAAIRWRNLLGQRYLYVYPGNASTVLRAGEGICPRKEDQLKCGPRSVVDVGELFNRLGPVVKALDPKQVNTFLDTVVAALDGNQDKIRKTIDDLAVVVSNLSQRDQAIGRLVENANVVAGAIDERDRQIRTILDNLVEVAKTFSSNTNILNAAVDDLGDFSHQLGGLLANNRREVDSIIQNLVVITDLVRQKLPTLDHTVAGLDEAAKRLFNASRYGEWLNQDICTGSVAAVVNFQEAIPCITDTNPGALTGPGAGAAAPARAWNAPTSGVPAMSELLTRLAA